MQGNSNTQRMLGQRFLINLSGRFDFSALRSFRDLYEPALIDRESSIIEINFRMVDYLDSAALGMLLLLRDKARLANRQVVLSGCKGTVLALLEVANFGQLFEIE